MSSEHRYDLRQGLRKGYADIAAGRFTSMTNDEIFAEAMQEMREEGYGRTSEQRRTGQNSSDRVALNRDEEAGQGREVAIVSESYSTL